MQLYGNVQFQTQAAQFCGGFRMYLIASKCLKTNILS